MKNEDSFYQLTLEHVSAKEEDLVSGLCFDFGASGISEKLDFQQTSLKYEPETLKKNIISLEVYFDHPPSPHFLEALALNHPSIKTRISEKEQKDWNEEWKKGFVEFELVDGVWIVPSWRRVPDEARSVLKIDPGMAFGTGTHETTKIAATLLRDYFVRNKSRDISVLDVGTGTGVLAMLAKILGANSVVATEIEPEARRVAKENIALNPYKTIEVLDVQVEQIHKKYDLVMANIIDGVLIDIQADLKKCLSENGYLLVTGILTEREDTFLKNFQLPEGYKWVKRLAMGEWIGFLGAKS